MNQVLMLPGIVKNTATKKLNVLIGDEKGFEYKDIVKVGIADSGMMR